jgi:predicted kinase
MADKLLILMQGAPGSGKSTMARLIARGLGSNAVILSTDEYWEADDGIYDFDVELLGAAHLWNQRRAAAIMSGTRESQVTIIDNTNIHRRDVVPYVGLAQVYGYDIQVVRVDPGLDECLRRNALRTLDRMIPEEVIRVKYAAMETLLPVA